MSFAIHLNRFGDYLKQKKQETSFLALWVTVMLVYPEFTLSNLMTLFTDDLKLSSMNAAALVNIRDALSSMFGIVGAIVVDIYLTNHGMIFVSSLFYLGGLILLNIKYLDALLVGIGLVLIAVGNSSLINSSNDLASEENRSPNLANYTKFAVQIIVVLVVDEDSTFFVGFIVSAILVSLVPAAALFYRNKKKKSFRKQIADRGTPLKHLPLVFIAAILKRGLSLPETPNELYEEDIPRHPLGHTNGLRFLDKAAIKEPLHQGEERSKWLCSITQVEECKRMLRMVPICTTFLAYGMVKSIGNTFFLEQANQMNTQIFYKEVPTAAFLYLAELSASLTKRLYTKFITEKLEGAGTKYAPTMEYGMGMVLSTLCCTVASWVTMEIHTQHGSLLSVFWLTPQFVIFGAMNGLATEGIEGFYSGQLPPSMKRYNSIFAEALIGVGSLFATLLVFLTEVAFNWFPDEEEQENNRFDRFYLLLTVVEITIFFICIFFAVRYRYEGDNTTEVHVQTEVPGSNEQASEHHAIIEVENGPPAENFTDTEGERLTPEEQDDELRELIQPADSTGHVGLAKRFKRLKTL